MNASSSFAIHTIFYRRDRLSKQHELPQWLASFHEMLAMYAAAVIGLFFYPCGLMDVR